MITIETAASYFAISLSLCLIPCTEMAMVISQASLQTRMAGIAITLGVCSAFALQIIALVFGITLIVQTSSVVFTILKIIGVIYLSYLAWHTLTTPLFFETEKKQGPSLVALYRRGFIVNISNPMNPLFILVFIPAFVNPEQGSATSQLIQLGALFITAIIIVYGAYSIFANIFGVRLLSSKKAQRMMQYITSTIIAIFAIYLAIAQQSWVQ